MSTRQNLIVIGNGMVGHKFLEAFAEKTESKAWNVTVFCEEPRPAYDRVHLTEFFNGSSAEELSLVEAGFFQNKGFELRLGDKAVAIDTVAKTVTSALPQRSVQREQWIWRLRLNASL